MIDHPLNFRRSDITFKSGGSSCAGWCYLPVGTPRPPAVVLGHGLGATREMRLDAYAERFAAAGFAVIVFTYRHFGDSGAAPRQMVSVRHQLADWDAALAYTRNRDDVDGNRIAIWGSSFGGGLVISVAAKHPEVRAIVSQCPFTDGVVSAMALGAGPAVKMLPLVVRDVFAAVRRATPVTVPIAGPPRSLALMNAPDALPGYQALIPPGFDWVNQVTARSVPRLVTYRPGRAAGKVRAPILFCVSDRDTVTPSARTLTLVSRAPRGDVRTYAAGHFDFYVGECFDALVADQTTFLQSHLGTAPPAVAR